MNVYIDDKELLKLYESGRSKKLRLPENVIDKFFATIQKIESATTIYDLWNDKSLNFEKLKGSQSRYSMRLNIKYRLETEISWKNPEKTIGDFNILKISSHYGD